MPDLLKATDSGRVAHLYVFCVLENRGQTGVAPFIFAHTEIDGRVAEERVPIGPQY